MHLYFFHCRSVDLSVYILYSIYVLVLSFLVSSCCAQQFSCSFPRPCCVPMDLSIWLENQQPKPFFSGHGSCDAYVRVDFDAAMTGCSSPPRTAPSPILCICLAAPISVLSCRPRQLACSKWRGLSGTGGRRRRRRHMRPHFIDAMHSLCGSSISTGFQVGPVMTWHVT